MNETYKKYACMHACYTNLSLGRPPARVHTVTLLEILVMPRFTDTALFVACCKMRTRHKTACPLHVYVCPYACLKHVCSFTRIRCTIRARRCLQYIAQLGRCLHLSIHALPSKGMHERPSQGVYACMFVPRTCIHGH